MWGTVFAPAAVRNIDRLPPSIAAACVEFITATLPTNPFRMSKPLGGDLHGYRSARRGEYRVLFEIRDEARVLHIVRVAHRRGTYRPW